MNIKVPNPNPAIINPDTIPLLFGKYFQPHTIGTIYINPVAKPSKHEYRIINVTIFYTKETINIVMDIVIVLMKITFLKQISLLI